MRCFISLLLNFFLFCLSFPSFPLFNFSSYGFRCFHFSRFLMFSIPCNLNILNWFSRSHVFSKLHTLMWTICHILRPPVYQSSCSRIQNESLMTERCTQEVMKSSKSLHTSMPFGVWLSAFFVGVLAD